MTRLPGDLGQYDVVADGTVVARRRRGLVAILGGGWPTADEVVRALLERRSSGAASPS
ncbi:MAG TPA: hypothetical protein VMV46_09845 [Thermoanaerobaculia bacterium]|nr:hypothetical protein [Thermoanaerobaculia bacterium]